MTMQQCQAGKCVYCQASDGGVMYPDCRGYAQKCGADQVTGCICGICSSDEACLNGQCLFCSHALCFGNCCLDTEFCDYASLACRPCQPVCSGKTCGPDGCGGTCGPGCADKLKCDATAGTCSTCTPSCGTRKCGPDKAGCNCGVCTGNTTCVEGLCEPCSRALCGGVCCGAGQKCDSATGHCVRCESQCGTALCGDDGCGGSCGGCDTGTKCVGGACVACAPACTGKDCGDDGCNGKCGDAKQCDPQTTGNVCVANKCAACPNPEQEADICARLQATCGLNIPVYDVCGMHGFAVSCGDPATVCTGDTVCDDATHSCQTPCVAETDDAFCARLGRVCGAGSAADNCGQSRYVASCGTCTGTTCTAGKCGP